MNNNIFGFFFKINKRNCQPFEFSLNKITSSQLSRVAAKIEKDKQTLDGSKDERLTGQTSYALPRGGYAALRPPRIRGF